MSISRGGVLTAVVAAGLTVVSLVSTGPAAWGAPPTNDNRADATLIRPPAKVTGTLVEATLEPLNDVSSCGATDSSVWYHFTAPANGAVVVELDAGGNMDATIDLYKQVRSKLTWVDCRVTDNQGQATIDRDGLDAGADYAIRVGNQIGSTADTFGLKVLVPTPPPSPPGRRLPRDGVRGRVDRVLNPGDAYHTRMVAGQTMRLSLHTKLCTSLQVFPPGTTSFTADEPVRTLVCGGYAQLTPTTTGRHYLVVRAARDREVHHYRLQVAPARADDTVPGILIHNHQRIRGSVNGRLDTRDLFRFDVTHRSALTLRLSGAPSMLLTRDDATRLEAGSFIERHLRAGRYYVAVSGIGRYELRLALRTITRADLLVDGRHRATIAPSETARFLLDVHPSVSGPGRIVVERFDPIEGWQFLRRLRPDVVRGSGRVKFHPPSVGRYRASATYVGSRSAAPADTGRVWLQVQRPLGG